MSDDRSNPTPDLVNQATSTLLATEDPAGGPLPMLTQRTLAAVWAAEAKAERAGAFRMRIAAAVLMGAASIAILVSIFRHPAPGQPQGSPSIAINSSTTKPTTHDAASDTQPAPKNDIVLAEATSPPSVPGEVSLTGRIMYEGPTPHPETIDVSAYPGIGGSVPGPIVDNALVVNPDRSLANVIVYIAGPVPASKNDEIPAPIVIRQKYAMIEPRVVAAMVGQRLLLQDEDSFPHAIHSLNSATTPAFNAPIMTRERRLIEPLAAVDTFQIGCEIHPWMRGWVRVFDHPYFDVTRSAGTFLIKDLPPGTYQLHAWHETLGDQEKTITVNGGEPISVDFTFEVAQEFARQQ